MKDLKDFSLFREITSYLEGTLTAINRDNINNAVKEFERKLYNLSVHHGSLLVTLRNLYSYKSYISQFLKVLVADTQTIGRAFRFILERLSILVEAEIEIVHIRIEHPQLEELGEISNQSVLILKDVTQTDIVEIVTSMNLLKIAYKPDRRIADFKYMVEKIGRFFGMKINNPEQLKHVILNRKTNVTSFLDRLRSALLDESMK